MSDYIDRQAAINACFDGWNNAADDCARNIKCIPAADVVPVVRCKDCIHYFNGNAYFMCGLNVLAYAKDDEFCSRGERREE